MILSFNYQLMAFAAAIAIGSIMGISYDAIRITRRVVRIKSVIVQLEDAVYWITAAIWAFLVVLNRFDGEIRLFNIVGIGVGMAIYFASLSRLVMALADKFTEVMKRFFRRMYRPIGRFWRIITYPVKNLIKLADKRTKKVLHLCKVCAKLKMRHFIRDMKTVLKK